MTDLKPVLTDLADYLADTGFGNLYRFIVSIQNYHLRPLAIGRHTRGAVLATETYLAGSLDGRRLLFALMTDASVAREQLGDRELRLADRLIEAGLLRAVDGGVAGAGWQLVAVGANHLFIDAALGFSETRAPDVYIGPETLMLLYYLDPARLPSGARALDIGTGTGAIALAAARAGARVVATDIADRPLFIAGVNRLMNRLDERVEIVREDVADTLRRGDRFDLVTCNPPFIAWPEELPAPLFARGPGKDGLDMMRAVVGRLDALLSDGGSALLVADLLGDERNPFYVTELEETARRFAVEVYIDQRVPAEGHAATLAGAAMRLDPTRAPEAVRERLFRFILEEQRAKNLYLTVIRVRRSATPGLLVCNRWLTVAD